MENQRKLKRGSDCHVGGVLNRVSSGGLFKASSSRLIKCIIKAAKGFESGMESVKKQQDERSNNKNYLPYKNNNKRLLNTTVCEVVTAG